MIYFTSDHHFGHANIIEYCKRPFASVEEMDETMVRRWNEVVRKEDTVYHLGDFAFGRTTDEIDSYVRRLNGRIYLVKGNHDRKPTCKSHAFFSQNERIALTEGGKHLILCHYPLDRWDGKHSGVLYLHGHSHGPSKEIPGRIDVGVDCWDFYPVTLNQILFRLKTRQTKAAAPPIFKAYVHTHTCSQCGRTYEHDNRSKVACVGAGTERSCNRCYLSHLY